MDPQGVLDAAQRRADALAAGDEPGLRELLHPGFVWTSHRGQRFDRETYIRSNLLADARRHSQRLIDPAVTIVGRTALLVCTVSDVVDVGVGVVSADGYPFTTHQENGKPTRVGIASRAERPRGSSSATEEFNPVSTLGLIRREPLRTSL